MIKGSLQHKDMTYNPQRLNQEETESLNRPITSKEYVAVSFKIPEIKA